MTKEQKQYCDDYSDHVDLEYYITNSGAETIDELEEYMEDNGAFDVEIIYYANAMEYLSEEDPSLNQSIGIASDMGFELENINSETLASLLASQVEREHFYNEKDDIDELFFNEDD